MSEKTSQEKVLEQVPTAFVDDDGGIFYVYFRIETTEICRLCRREGWVHAITSAEHLGIGVSADAAWEHAAQRLGRRIQHHRHVRQMNLAADRAGNRRERVAADVAMHRRRIGHRKMRRNVHAPPVREGPWFRASPSWH